MFPNAFRFSLINNEINVVLGHNCESTDNIGLQINNLYALNLRTVKRYSRENDWYPGQRANFVIYNRNAGFLM